MMDIGRASALSLLVVLLYVTSGYCILDPPADDTTCFPAANTTAGVHEEEKITVNISHYYKSKGNFVPYGPILRKSSEVTLDAGQRVELPRLVSQKNDTHTLVVEFTGSQVCVAASYLYRNYKKSLLPEEVHDCRRRCVTVSAVDAVVEIPIFKEEGGEIIHANPICCVYEYNNYIRLRIVDPESRVKRQCYAYSGKYALKMFKNDRQNITCPAGALCSVHWDKERDNDEPRFVVGCSGVTSLGKPQCFDGCRDDYSVSGVPKKEACEYCCKDKLCNTIDAYYSSGTRAAGRTEQRVIVWSTLVSLLVLKCSRFM